MHTPDQQDPKRDRGKVAAAALYCAASFMQLARAIINALS